MRVGTIWTMVRVSILTSSLLAVGVHSAMVWSNVDHFDVILQSKEDAPLWAKLVKDIRAIHELWLLDKPTVRIEGFQYPGGKTPETFDDFALVALPIIEDVRMLLEPVDDDTVGLELALMILQQPPFNIDNAADAASILDTLTGYFINIPNWIEGLVSGSQTIGDWNTNPLSAIFWLFGASVATSPTSGKSKIIWDTKRPAFIRKLFLHLKWNLEWAAEEFEAQAPLIEALAPEYSIETEKAFNSMVLWTGHYAQLIKRVLDDLAAIQMTESFEAVYDNSGSPSPVKPKRVIKQYKKPKGGERQTSLVDGIKELRAGEALRTEGGDRVETNDSSPRN
ncbi:hypothetical protein TWF696_008446 [Orbilia brochopaga]|uniref:Uncharacterized protein n=1 Tax=Orbilia brochopaga TaxID=3140254 RepID=A0AAV9UFZ8_9PEZI